MAALRESVCVPIAKNKVEHDDNDSFNDSQPDSFNFAVH